MEAVSKSKRFANLKISNFVNILDKKIEKQFSAITIFLPDNTIYISFRGTDSTVIGWKEDFNMGFISHIPSQLSSKEYLETIANLFPNKIRIGGHSKGGNLAIYSALYASKDIQDRIISIDNNDGPGFSEEIINQNNYSNILNKIHTYVPQSSVVGMLLHHEESYTIVRSTAKGIMQHDAYSWQLLGTEFIKMDQITNGSKILDKTLKDWIKDTTPEQREQFLNILFEIFNATKVEDITELQKNWYKNAIILVKSYKNIDDKSKEILNKTISSLTSLAKNNLFNQK